MQIKLRFQTQRCFLQLGGEQPVQGHRGAGQGCEENSELEGVDDDDAAAEVRARDLRQGNQDD